MKTKSGSVLMGGKTYSSSSPLLNGTPVSAATTSQSSSKQSRLTQPTFSSSARYNQTMAQRNENKKTSSNTSKKKSKRSKSSSPVRKSSGNVQQSSSRTNTVTIPSAHNISKGSSNNLESVPLRSSTAMQYQEQLKKYETLFNKYQLLYDQQKSKNHSIEKKIVAVEEKMKEMDLQVTTQAKKYSSLRHRVDNIEGAVSSQKKSIEELFTLHETKLKIFEERLTELRDIQERYRRKTAYLQKKFKDIADQKPNEPDSRDRSRERIIVSSLSSSYTEEEEPKLVVLSKRTPINSPVFRKETTSTEFLSTESENEMLEEKPKSQKSQSSSLRRSTNESPRRYRKEVERSDSESDYPPQKTIPKKEPTIERGTTVSRSKEQELKQRYQDLRKAYGRVYGRVD